MLVPHVYEEVSGNLMLPRTTDMSHSNKCDVLTLSLYEGIRARKLPVRRELHQAENNLWHYVIVHAAENDQPRNDDLITDLNPWQYENNFKHSGPLHGPRYEVMNTLKSADAPPWFVALRGIGSITAPHTLLKTPYMSR